MHQVEREYMFCFYVCDIKQQCQAEGRSSPSCSCGQSKGMKATGFLQGFRYRGQSKACSPAWYHYQVPCGITKHQATSPKHTINASLGLQGRKGDPQPAPETLFFKVTVLISKVTL